MADHRRITYWHHYYGLLFQNAYQYLVIVLLVMALSTLYVTYENYQTINHTLLCSQSVNRANITQKKLTDSYYEDVIKLNDVNGGTAAQRVARADKYQRDLAAIPTPVC